MEQLRQVLVDAGLPAYMLPLIGVLLAVQLVLQLIALIDLVRRPHVTLGDRKWAWALIILLGESIGALLYFALGRVPGAANEERSRPAVDVGAAQEKAQAIVDQLYGPQHADEPRDDGTHGGR